MEVKRTKEQVEALIKALEDELESLTDYDAFGESNDDGKEETRQCIAELQYCVTNDLKSVSDEDSAVGYWLTGRDNTFGTDYDVF